MKLKLIIGLITLSFVQDINADLKVISDYGGDSMLEYYDAINPQDESSVNQQQSFLSDLPKDFRRTPDFDLPSASSTLKPGLLEPIKIDLVGIQPFIIIGYDDLSIKWLKQRKDELEQISDLRGFVVNVESAEQFGYLKSLINIPLSISGGDLPDSLKMVKSYPALINSNGVEQ